MQIYEVVLHCTCKSCREQNSGGYRGEARGGGAPPLIFRPNWSPKGRKNFFWVFWLVTDYKRGKSVLNKSWTLSSKRTNKQTGVHIFVKICICGSWAFVLPCPKGTKKTGNKKRATCFATLLQNELMLRVLLPMFKPVNNLICWKNGFEWVAKRATSLFNSFCSNVAKQVSRFLLPVFPYLKLFCFVLIFFFFRLSYP